MAGRDRRSVPSELRAIADQQAAPLIAQLKSNPRDPKLPADIGNMYYDAQSYPTAIDYYQRALALEPKNDLVRTDMATAMFYLGSTDEALKEINRALADNPKNLDALFNRGIFKWQGKMDVQGAVADWEALLQLNPNWEKADLVRQKIAEAKRHENVKPGQKTNKPAM